MNTCTNCKTDSAPHNYIEAGAKKEKLCAYCARRIGLAVGRRRDSGHESKCLSEEGHAGSVLWLIFGAFIFYITAYVIDALR